MRYIFWKPIRFALHSSVDLFRINNGVFVYLIHTCLAVKMIKILCSCTELTDDSF